MGFNLLKREAVDERMILLRFRARAALLYENFAV